jgi:thymidylate kinase
MNERRRPRLILVEGPDGAGKTTLVDFLVSKMGDVYQDRCGIPEGPPLREYLDKAMDGWYARKEVVIFDRFHLGEQVYGPIMRGKDNLGRIKCDVLEYFLTEMFSPVVILARPPFEACREVWSGRLDEEYVHDEDHMLRVWEAFGNLNTSLTTVHYDRTVHNPERLLRRIVL